MRYGFPRFFVLLAAARRVSDPATSIVDALGEGSAPSLDPLDGDEPVRPREPRSRADDWLAARPQSTRPARDFEPVSFEVGAVLDLEPALRRNGDTKSRKGRSKALPVARAGRTSVQQSDSEPSNATRPSALRIR